MTLDETKQGQEINITHIADAHNRQMLLRMGICEGTKIRCENKIRKGPVIIKNKRNTIAIGYNLAKNIYCKEI